MNHRVKLIQGINFSSTNYDKSDIVAILDAIQHTQLVGITELNLTSKGNPVLEFFFEANRSITMNAVNFVFAARIAYIVQVAKQRGFSTLGNVTIISTVASTYKVAQFINVKDGLVTVDRGRSLNFGSEIIPDEIVWENSPTAIQLDVNDLQL